MDEEKRLAQLIGDLNEALGDVTPYRLAVVSPKEIQPIDKNARYMSKRVYDQLVGNVKRDRNLSSLPFCWRSADGSLVALSGNHRVMAASDAGIPLVLVLYTDAQLSQSEVRAIQLSHNSLVGQDNPTTLRELWQEIETVEAKIYSGLDDGLIETMERINIQRIVDEPLRFQELIIMFMPSEIDRLEDVMKRLGAANKTRFAARVEDFERFLDALLDFKVASNIVNTGTAIMAMIEIIEGWLEHNEDEHEQKDETG